MSSSCSSSSSPSLTSGVLVDWVLDKEPVETAIFDTIGNTKKVTGVPLPLVKLVVAYLKAMGQERGSVFGASEWATYFGSVAPAPALPKDIEQIWQGSCPIFPGKKTQETHMLVYIPTKVGDSEDPLTLTRFAILAHSFFPSCKIDYVNQYILDKLGNNPIEKPFWAMMTKEVVPNSRKKHPSSQDAIVANFTHYEVPKLQDVYICMMAHHVSTNTRLFSENPTTLTRCQEVVQNVRVTIGSFKSCGLRIINEPFKIEEIGIAAVRKFYEKSSDKAV